MFRHHGDRLDEVTPRVLFHWFLLSFMAGSLNAGGFLACSRFVTHVTGFFTLAGINFAEDDPRSGVGMLAVPLFFLFGAMTSAYCIDRRLNIGKAPRYGLVMTLVSTCLALVVLGGEYHFFGAFDLVLVLKRDFLFMALLGMASGLTNAAITTSSGAFVRVTHMTGNTTDLGIGLMRVLAMDKNDERYRTEKLANIYRAGNISCFTAGAFAGALLFLRVQYLGFLLPLALALYATKQAYGSSFNDR